MSGMRLGGRGGRPIRAQALPAAAPPPSSSSPGGNLAWQRGIWRGGFRKIETSHGEWLHVTAATPKPASGPSTKGGGPSMPGWVEPGGSTRSRGQADPSTPPKWVEKAMKDLKTNDYPTSITGRAPREREWHTQHSRVLTDGRKHYDH
jgi:hypothetical protein